MISIPARWLVYAVESLHDKAGTIHIKDTIKNIRITFFFGHDGKLVNLYSETSKQRTSWDQHGLSLIVLNREVSSFQRLKLH